MSLHNEIFYIRTLTNIIIENWPKSSKRKSSIDVDEKICQIYETLMQNQKLCTNPDVKKILQKIPEDSENEQIILIKSLIETEETFIVDGYEFVYEQKEQYNYLMNLVKNDFEKELSSKHICKILVAFKENNISDLISIFTEKFSNDISVIYSFIAKILEIEPKEDFLTFKQIFFNFSSTQYALADSEYKTLIKLFTEIGNDSSNDVTIFKLWVKIKYDFDGFLSYVSNVTNLQNELENVIFKITDIPYLFVEIKKGSSDNLIFIKWMKKFLLFYPKISQQEAAVTISDMVSSIIYLSQISNASLSQSQKNIIENELINIVANCRTVNSMNFLNFLINVLKKNCEISKNNIPRALSLIKNYSESKIIEFDKINEFEINLIFDLCPFFDHQVVLPLLSKLIPIKLTDKLIMQIGYCATLYFEKNIYSGPPNEFLRYQSDVILIMAKYAREYADYSNRLLDKEFEVEFDRLMRRAIAAKNMIDTLLTINDATLIMEDTTFFRLNPRDKFCYAEKFAPYLNQLSKEKKQILLKLLFMNQFYKLDSILGRLAKISSLEEQMEILELILPLIAKTEMGIHPIFLFDAIENVPRSERNQIHNGILELWPETLQNQYFSNLNDGYWYTARLLLNMKGEDRSKFIEKVKNIAFTIKDTVFRLSFFKTVGEIAYTLFLYSPEEGASLLQGYAAFLGSIYNTNRDIVSNIQWPYNLITTLKVLPPSVQKSSLEVLLRLQEISQSKFRKLLQSSSSEFINFLISNNAIKVDELLPFWTELMRTEPNIKRVKEVTDFITREFHIFGFSQEHEIVQEAIRMGILIETSNDILNPYKLFERLKTRRAQPVDWSAIKPVEEILNGVKVHFNPVFLATELPQFNLTFGQLPKFSATFLDDQIAKLNRYIESKPEAALEIINMLIVSCEDLLEDSIGDGTLKQILATARGKADDKVPVIAARFIAIVAFIETLNDDRKEGEIFSEKEETFLRMLAAIQFCRAGKKEGINTYYLNVLPAKFRYSKKASQEDPDLDTLRSKESMVEILLEEVEKMFSGQNHLMKDIANVIRDEVEQAAHQGVYLKNMIGDVVGLPDKLEFDAYTHTLYVGLVSSSKEELLKKFYKYFLPSAFVRLIQKQYDLEEKPAIESLKKIGILI